jgi:acetolactate synthase I/II/III large subunit
VLAETFAGPSGWGPHAVFRTLRNVLPPETIATADSGAHRILVSQMWTSFAPRQMFQSTALCTMACALPLAAGARIGRPDVPVIAFMGDAGLEMGAGELATLRDLRLPVILCVLVDESLALIELKQRGSQRRNLGVDFGGTDFPALAQAFGGVGVWVDDVENLRQAAVAAMACDTFTLIAARISKGAYDGAF